LRQHGKRLAKQRLHRVNSLLAKPPPPHGRRRLGSHSNRRDRFNSRPVSLSDPLLAKQRRPRHASLPPRPLVLVSRAPNSGSCLKVVRGGLLPIASAQAGSNSMIRTTTSRFDWRELFNGGAGIA
jgi:hypothetical protein